MSAPRPTFKNREEAGQILAEELSVLSLDDPLVLALPRGGVPVAFEVAKVLEASLDLLIVRKLGVPGREELAMGAISQGGIQVLDDRIISQMQISPESIHEVVEKERVELERRQRIYRAGLPPPTVTGRTIILVDDGIATGSTMRAAVALLRQQKAAFIVVAVPTAPPDTISSLEEIADIVVAAMTPQPFVSVGQSYLDFSQVSDREVRHLLEVDEIDANS